MKRISLNIHDDLHTQLKETAEANGQTKTYIIETALKKYFQGLVDVSTPMQTTSDVDSSTPMQTTSDVDTSTPMQTTPDVDTSTPMQISSEVEQLKKEVDRLRSEEKWGDLQSQIDSLTTQLSNLDQIVDQRLERYLTDNPDMEISAIWDILSQHENSDMSKGKGDTTETTPSETPLETTKDGDKDESPLTKDKAPDEAIEMIKKEIECSHDFWKDIPNQPQSDQVKAIANSLIKLGLKGKDYSLDRSYIPKWNKGRTARPSSPHFLAYQFYIAIYNL